MAGSPAAAAGADGGDIVLVPGRAKRKARKAAHGMPDQLGAPIPALKWEVVLAFLAIVVILVLVALLVRTGSCSIALPLLLDGREGSAKLLNASALDTQSQGLPPSAFNPLHPLDSPETSSLTEGSQAPASPGEAQREGAGEGEEEGEGQAASAAPCVEPPVSPVEPSSSWHYLKVIPPPAVCRVQGMVIERLEPEYNFRRGYALGYTSDVEDKDQLLPYLRAIQDPRMAARPRRVLLDLGANLFTTSVLWFLRHYPLEFTEIHAFEAKDGLFRKPKEGGPAWPELMQRVDTASQVPGAGKLPVPASTLAKITLHEGLVWIEDKEPIPGEQLRCYNITRFILDELRLTAKDTVVVKMDIEHAEWKVLPVWLQIPGMSSVIDELFVEIHYQHETMWRFSWKRGPSREEAALMFRNLRAKGFFVHPWP